MEAGLRGLLRAIWNPNHHFRAYGEGVGVREKDSQDHITKTDQVWGRLGPELGRTKPYLKQEPGPRTEGLKTG